MEETSDRMLRVKETSDTKSVRGGVGGRRPGDRGGEGVARLRRRDRQGPKAPRAKFTAIPIGSSETDGSKGRDLGKGVQVPARSVRSTT